MAFFSETLAHSVVTGIALGFLIDERLGGNLDPMIVLFVFTMVLSLVMAKLSRNGVPRSDTVIAFTFAGSVAFGVLLIFSWWPTSGKASAKSPNHLTQHTKTNNQAL